MAAPTPTTLVNRYQTCVYPEAPSLPDDVARRTLFSFFFFFSLRRSLRCFSNDNLCFNDTPARACKQLAEPERRTFLFFFLIRIFSSLLSYFVYLFIFFFSSFYIFMFFFFCTSHTTCNENARKSHFFSTPTRSICLFIFFFLSFFFFSFF